MVKADGHVVVIGGGLIGFSAAYHLQRAGMRVTVIERGSEESAGCSTGNAGMVVPSHFVPLAAPGVIWKGLRWMFDPESPFSIRPRPSWELVSWGWRFYRASSPARVKRAMPVLRDMALRSRAIFGELAEREGFEFGLQKKGLLMLCKTRAALKHESELAATANSLGVEAEVLDAEGVRAKDPGVEIDVAGGVHFAQDCHLDPARFLGDLRRVPARVFASASFFAYRSRWRARDFSSISSSREAGARPVMRRKPCVRRDVADVPPSVIMRFPRATPAATNCGSFITTSACRGVFVALRTTEQVSRVGASKIASTGGGEVRFQKV